MNFADQFHNNRETIHTSCGSIEVLDITPANLITDVPVLFAPGWREIPELQRGCLEEVYNSGRRVITFVHSNIACDIGESTNNFPKVEHQKAKTILEILEAKNIDQVDVITHSEGGINSVIAATLNPKKFRNMVLVTPGGLMGKDILVRLGFGFLQHIFKAGITWAILNKGYLHRKKVTHKKIGVKENISFLLQETNAISSFDIHPLIIELTKKGIKIAALFGERDTVFPFKKIIHHLSQLAEAPNYGFNIFATKHGGHELYLEPEKVMPQVLGLLQGLESIEGE